MYNDGIAFTGNRQRNLLLTPIVGIDGDILFCNRISIVVNQSDGDGKCGASQLLEIRIHAEKS